jgi:PAS domain S-box-containing protein
VVTVTPSWQVCVTASGPKTILLVEDEAIILLSQQKTLEDLGYEVLTARSGENAIEAAASRPAIELILMDINLGTGMNGIEAASVILRDRDIPVVFLSSHTEKEVVEKTGNVTSYGYIIKESGINVLDASLKMAFTHHEALRELREKEERLRTSERRLARAQAISHVGNWELDLRTGRMVVSDEAFHIWGVEPVPDISLSFIQGFVLPQYRPTLDFALRRLIDQKGPYDEEFEIRRSSDNEVRFIASKAELITEDGVPVGVTGVLQDITERKRTESALRTSRMQLAEAADLARLAHWEADFMTGIFTFNDAYYDLLGTTVEKEGGYRMPFDDYVARFGHPDDRPHILRFADALRAAPDSDAPLSVEGRIIRTDGEVRHLATRLRVVRDPDGLPVKAFGVNQDITERRHTEAALRASEGLYHSVVEGSLDGVLLTRPDGTVLAANTRACDMFRMTEQEFLAVGRVGVIVDDDRLRTALADRAETGKWQGELTLRRSDGSTFPAELSSRIFMATDGKEATSMVIRDITARKDAEESLRQTRAAAESQAAELRAVMEAVPAVILVAHDGECRRLSGNHVANRILGVPLHESVSGDGPVDEWTPRHRIISGGETAPVEQLPLDRALKGQEVENSEWDVLFPDGTKRTILGSASPLRTVDGTTKGAVGAFVDITDRKEVEEQLRSSLAEKEVLLKEVHHRVKNNLAAIIGLLDMQQRGAGDPVTIAALKDLQDRIASMALVHEKLYRSEDLSDIDFEDYLEALISHLRTSFGQESAIRCAVISRDITMTLDAAIPCGMIVNELVSNALKHAFPHGMCRENPCDIVVSITRDGNAYVLTVADNGVGLPADFDWRTTKSLGLRIVRMLGQHQLGGKIELDRTKGTSFTLTFYQQR